MHIMYFTERPYQYVAEEEVIKNGGSWGLPNALFNPVKGGELYNRYFDERCTPKRWSASSRDIRR